MKQSPRDHAFDALLRELARAPALPLEPTPDPLLGRGLGHYRVEARLGAGGMGVVYRAMDMRLERPVALKVLHPQVASDPRRRRNLTREAQNAASVAHPNVAAIYDIGDEDGVAFIAMELVDGRPLASLVPAAGLSVREAIKLALPIAEGMAHAHRCGIAHGDLTASNVMVDAAGKPKILDFGLSRLVSEDVIAPGSSLHGGTRPYVAPEVVSSPEAVDARADVYAFGVLLHLLSTGALPGEGVRAPGPLRSILRRCLDECPERRFEDGAKLHAALMKRHSAGSRAPWRAALLAVALLGVAVWLVSGSEDETTIAASASDAGSSSASLRRLSVNSPKAIINYATMARMGAMSPGPRSSSPSMGASPKRSHWTARRGSLGPWPAHDWGTRCTGALGGSAPISFCDAVMPATSYKR